MNVRDKAAREQPREKKGVFPATFPAMEAFIAELGLRSGWFPDRADTFAAELLLREVLTNAVEHGSAGGPGRRVRCVVRVRGRRLTISVQDEGAGFDWRAALDHAADLSDLSGRGLEILRTYSTSFRFNAKGNSVTLRRQFGMELAE
jgi:anti-sigma regulatory factor (Ser/Thr protein kinase)